MPCKTRGGDDHKRRSSRKCKGYCSTPAASQHHETPPSTEEHAHQLIQSVSSVGNDTPLTTLRSPLADIPIELKQRLVYFLSGNDIIALLQLCRSWSAALSDQKFWTIIYHKLVPNVPMRFSLPPAKKRKLGGQQAAASPEPDDVNWRKRYLEDVGRICVACGGITKDRCPLSGDRVCRSCQIVCTAYTKITKSRPKANLS
ncbi:hypothetical protein BC832DRAFT_349297 [Gaertneriomyces semiglobifer]|nr:hypothetical protein BC832DRAFT_349297 [Gaertneriomyces semiglobifer]